MQLRRHLKRWFVPHKQNDHRPHLIRAHGLAIMAVVIIGVQISANLLRPPEIRVLAYATDITPLDLFNGTNQQRVAGGLKPLTLSAQLNQSASLKAQNMFAENYWAHVSPSGIQPWHWFIVAGYNYQYAGENLARDFDTSSGTIDGWMNSPGHRANIMNPNYTDVGFAVVNGTLTGTETTLVVAHYGSKVAGNVAAAAPSTPRPVVAAAAKPVATPAPPTPVPTAAVTPTPSPSPTPGVVAPAVKGEITPLAPASKSYSLFRPLSIISTLNWGSVVTIGLLGVLLIVYFFTHLAVWRKGLRRWRSSHYRLLAAVQVSGLAVVITVLAISGFGSVG